MSVIKSEDSGIGCMRQMINGVGLTSFDFGDTMTDYCQETSEMIRVFVPRPATAEILEKYRITEDEYQEVCETLVRQFADWDEVRRRPYIQAVPTAQMPKPTDIAAYRRRNRRSARRYGKTYRLIPSAIPFAYTWTVWR